MNPIENGIETGQIRKVIAKLSLRHRVPVAKRLLSRQLRNILPQYTEVVRKDDAGVKGVAAPQRLDEHRTKHQRERQRIPEYDVSIAGVPHIIYALINLGYPLHISTRRSGTELHGKTSCFLRIKETGQLIQVGINLISGRWAETEIDVLILK